MEEDLGFQRQSNYRSLVYTCDNPCSTFFLLGRSTIRLTEDRPRWFAFGRDFLVLSPDFFESLCLHVGHLFDLMASISEGARYSSAISSWIRRDGLTRTQLKVNTNLFIHKLELLFCCRRFVHYAIFVTTFILYILLVSFIPFACLPR